MRSPYTQSLSSQKDVKDLNLYNSHQSTYSIKNQDQSRDAALASPTVSSSVPGCSEAQPPPSLHQQPTSSSTSSSKPGSLSSSVGSPSVHSTTPSVAGPPYESIKPPSSAESSSKGPGSVESYANPPSRQESVDSTASVYNKSASMGTGSPMSPAMSNNNYGSSQLGVSSSMENLVGSPADGDKTLVDLSGSDDQYTSNFKSDVFTCYSQPSSPAKAKANSQLQNMASMYKTQSMNDNLHRHAIKRLQSQKEFSLKQEPDRYESHTDDEKQRAQNQNAGECSRA